MMYETPYFLQFEIFGDIQSIDCGFEWHILSQLHPDIIYLKDNKIMIKNIHHNFNYPIKPSRTGNHFWYNSETNKILINPMYLGTFCNANNLRVEHKLSLFDYFSADESERTLIYFAHSTGKPLQINFKYKTNDLNVLARYVSPNATMMSMTHNMEDKSVTIQVLYLFVLNGSIQTNIVLRKTFQSMSEMSAFIDQQFNRALFTIWERLKINILKENPEPYGYLKGGYNE